MKQTNEFIKINDELSVYIVGYETAGESIIINLGDKFFALIDCFKTAEHFKTLDILKEIGVDSLDLICWTHTDEDHTLGLSSIIEEYVDYEKTLFITPEGFQPKDIFHKYESKFHKEYKEIFELAEKNIHLANHHSANNGFSRTFLYKFSGSEVPLRIEIKGYTPLSFVVKEFSLKFVEEYFSLGEKGRSRPNYFSITLKITVTHPDIAPISICLTSDLDNYIIKRMKTADASECFGDNLIMKIPHHGSRNSSELINFVSSLGYAATTTYKNSRLPKDEILREYKQKKSLVSHTGVNTGKYGIIKYNITLKKHAINNINVEHIGTADFVP